MVSVALAVSSLTVTGGATARAAEADTSAVDSSWVAPRASVFGMGDSLFAQCGDTLGVGSRSVGMVGWWGGTTQDMRNRMTSGAEKWPYTTEPSHAEELAHFRYAGSWVIGLGTNDVRVGTLTQFRANVDWFLQQARGRPVQWFSIYYPDLASKAASFNAVLRDAATRWPNLRILDWYGLARSHPQLIAPDRLHIADHAAGCDDGRFRLIRSSVPPVAGTSAPPPSDVPVPVPTPDPITVKYDATGGAGGPLGAASGGGVCDLKKDGCVRPFARGLIAWSATTGARMISRAEIRAAWSGYYAESGPLGYPIEDTVCGLRDGGCAQRFETGSVHWSPATGARISVDSIRASWQSLGAERGALGYPTTNTICDLRANGCFQSFQRAAIYWTAATGPQVVKGAIRGRWAAQGWETGVLGYPTGPEICGLRNGGCYQTFQGGVIHFSPATGAQFTRGAIRGRWAAHGWETGFLGYPTGGEICGLRDGGCFQTFQGGSIYFSPATGAHAVSGAIRARWAALGWERGRLGYPTTEVYPVTGGLAQRFQGGRISWIDGRIV